MATSAKKTAKASGTKAARKATKAPPRRAAKKTAKKTAKKVVKRVARKAAPRATTARAAAAGTAADMLFESTEFKPIPPGASRVILGIVDAGPQQSATLGVVLREQRPGSDEFVFVRGEEIDNLPTTPEGVAFAFTPTPGSRYALLLKGTMHSLTTDDAPLELELAVTVGSSGALLEDFGGSRSFDGRFARVAGRALLEAAP